MRGCAKRDGGGGGARECASSACRAAATGCGRAFWRGAVWIDAVEIFLVRWGVMLMVIAVIN